MRVRRASALLALVLGIAGGSLATPARAGAISVMPVRVDVPAAARFCALTVGNDSDHPVTVQVRGFAWSRDEGGADILTPEADFVVNPPMTTIAPHATRLVRCSLPAATPGSAEKSWRLIVDELPDPTLAQPGVVQTLLRLSVPVFRGDPRAAPRLTAALDGEGLRIVNAGDAHARISAVTLVGDGGPVTLARPFYLLAGGAQRVPDDHLPKGLTQVRVQAEEGEFTVALSRP